MAFEPEVTLANYTLAWTDADSDNSDGHIVNSTAGHGTATNAAFEIRTENSIVHLRCFITGNENKGGSGYADVATAKATALAIARDLGMVAPA
jgi:hypothetical protein